MTRPKTASTHGPSLAGNALWLLVGEAAGKIASFVFVVAVARGLGATQYGFFNFGISFVPLFLMFGTLGLNMAFFRDLAKDRGRISELFASGFVLRFSFGAAAVAVAIALVPLFVRDRAYILAIVLIAGALLFDELSSFLGVVFKAFERMKFHALVLVVNRVLSTVLAIVAVAAGADLTVVAAAYLLGSILAFGFGWWAIKTYFPPVRIRDASRDTIRTLLLHGAPIGIAAILNMALFRIDAVMLQGFHGPVEVAMYGIAYRFFESFLFVGWSLSNVVLPRITRDGTSAESARTFHTAAALMLAFYLPIAAGAPFAGEWAVRTIFGERYVEAAPGVFWLAAAGVFYSVAHLARISTIAVGQRKAIAWVAGAALLTNLVANAIVIPRYGFLGAAITTFATEVLEAVLLVWVVLRAGIAVRPNRLVMVPIVASGAMALTLFLTQMEGLGAAILGTVVMLGVLPIAGFVLAPEESKRAVALLRRGRGAPIEGTP